MKTVEQYILQFKENRRHIHKAMSVLSVLSLFVVVSVFWNLRLSGVTIANSATCGIEEHFHTEECFILEQVCELEEYTHVHNEECNTAEQACELEEYTHVHTEQCSISKQICELEEHIHDFSCFSDSSADVETVEIWEATLPELSEDKANNLINIALSQIGYQESKDNFVVAEDTQIHNGITRYGQWYGIPHGEWSNMFTSFCLTYAGFSDVPINSGAEAMRLEWLNKNIYRHVENYNPVAGDIVFLDKNLNGQADSTAIIISNDGIHLLVVEGDIDNQVAEMTYDVQSKQIMGYGVTISEDKVLMSSPMAIDDETLIDAPIIANTVTYSASILTSDSKFVIYTKTTDNKYYALDGNANAVEIYIDSTGAIRSDVADVNTLYWTFKTNNQKYDNKTQYVIKNEASGKYLHPYQDNNTNKGVLHTGDWGTVLYDHEGGVRYRGVNQNQYAVLSNTSFTNINDRNKSSTFYFGRIEYCTLWLDGTNGGIMSSNGSHNKSYSVMKGGSIKLPETWETPKKYQYKINGWVDIQTGTHYAPGADMIVNDNTVLYADWVANTYDIGVYNNHVVDTVSTNDFITTRVFDYNSLLNMLSSKVSVSVSDSSHSETWSHVESGKVAYKNQESLNFSFNDHDSSGKITNPTDLNSENKYTGGGTYEGIYNDELSKVLFDVDSAFNSATGEGIIGKHYLGKGDHLFQYETDPTNEYYGYYYYDAKKNASSYNQTNQRFYVYDYLERTSDSSKESDATKYSDFVPLNSPYANNPGRNISNYTYGGDDNEYQSVSHYQYDSRYTENGSSESNIITNFWFGMSVEIDFYLPNKPGEIVENGEYGNKDIYGNEMHFLFEGDDDVWVVIDNKTVILDIGGIHKAESGEINFSTGEVSVGNTTKTLSGIEPGRHTITIYYVERGSSMSNCAIYFNLAPRYSLTIQKEDVLTQTLLNGAKFAVYTDPSCTKDNLAQLWTSKESYLNDDSFAKEFEIKNGKLTMWGFGASNVYYIKETSPPKNGGYSLSNAIIKLKFNKTGDASYDVEIIEEKDENGNTIPISNGFSVHGFKIDEGKQEAYIVVTNGQNWISETTTVYVDKKWNDSINHSYDSVKVYLNIVEGESIRPIREITLSDANNWKYEWTNLPKYDENKKLITYSVSESYYPGYSSVIEPLEPGEYKESWDLVDDYSLTNNTTYILKTKNGYLSANTTGVNLKYVDEETAKQSNLAKWTISIDGNNITFKNGNGRYLSYSHGNSSSKRILQMADQSKNFSVENKTSGFSIYYVNGTRKYYLSGINNSGNGTGSTTTTSSSALVFEPYSKTEAYNVKNIGYRIINTPLDEETSIKVTKKWMNPNNDPVFYDEEKVTVHLLANGQKVGRTVILSLKNNWTDTFKGLPYKDSNGNVINYSVEEGFDSIDWVPIYDPIIQSAGAVPTYETVITNHYRWSGEVELPATGSHGYSLYILIGSLLVIGPFVYSFRMGKKQGRGYKK